MDAVELGVGGRKGWAHVSTCKAIYIREFTLSWRCGFLVRFPISSQISTRTSTPYISMIEYHNRHLEDAFIVGRHTFLGFKLLMLMDEE